MINNGNILASNPIGLKRRILKVEHEVKHTIKIYLFCVIGLKFFFFFWVVICPTSCALGIICYHSFLGQIKGENKLQNEWTYKLVLKYTHRH